MDGAGNGGAVHPVQHRQGVVGQLEPQDHQGGQDPVAEDQLVMGAGAGGTLAWAAAAPLEWWMAPCPYGPLTPARTRPFTSVALSYRSVVEPGLAACSGGHPADSPHVGARYDGSLRPPNFASNGPQ